MFRGLVIGLALALTPAPAFAVINQAVKDACRKEYLAFCSGTAIPSEELRGCFRAHMLQLSNGCLKALADNKEATKADVDMYLAANRKTK
jgi:hypothetical protein